MNFSVQGKATPRSYQRVLPGSARGRPQSGKTHINPITGEEMVYIPTPRAEEKHAELIPRAEEKRTEVTNGNSNGIPSLDLHYLKDDDVRTGAIDIDLNDYSLDTPNSASTVSWGTARSGRGRGYPGVSAKAQTTVPSMRTTVRPADVPELNLDNARPPSARRQVRQPTAWDGDPVPTNLPQPSERYKQLYQQYSEDMKLSYRAHINQKDKKEGEANTARSARQAATQEQQHMKEGNGEQEGELGQDALNDSWTRQRYTGKQLLRKKDAEDLLEQNKKLKLVETVMIDQLSRAVISDPDQNERPTSRLSSSRRGRGSNRYLHDSKISTAATATENLLSKRVRFGARILTRNGHDAMRELTGFFFDVDRTLTVYEFRQFGKSAKAMPFIYRGQYQHTSGPKQGRPYSLSDIYTGANLKIPTDGQLALTDSLAENSHIVLRITEVDEAERRALLAEKDERLHGPSKVELENRDYLYMIQDEVQEQIRKRGVRTVTGLGRFYRKLDQYNTGILDQYDLEKGLKTFHIKLEPEKLEEVFEILDPEGSKLLDYGDYMHSVIGEMNEYRHALVRKAFHKLDWSKKGLIHISDVDKFFNVNSKYRPVAGGDTSVSALQAFLEAVRENPKQEHISYIEFEEYYQGLSAGVDSDKDFANILQNTWNV